MCPSESRLPHSADLRKHRYDAPNHVYLLTKRRNALASLPLHKPPTDALLLDSLYWLQNAERIWLLAFVLMPDHLHLVLAPRTGFTLASIMRSFCGFTAKRARDQALTSGRLWAEEYHDTLLTGRGEIEPAVRYVQLNPIRKEYVASPEEWSNSSAHPLHAGRMDWAWYGRINQ